jgi:hypothetical protein
MFFLMPVSRKAGEPGKRGELGPLYCDTGEGEQGELWTEGGKCGIDAERLKGLAEQ